MPLVKSALILLDFCVKMDPTREFFSKLRKVVLTLETETAKLQGVFEDRDNNEDDDSETTARAMRAYHDLNGEVCSLKEQLRDQLADQKEQESEVRNFIKACRVMEQRLSKDTQAVRTHLEKYGYQAPCDSQRPGKLKDQEAEAESKVAEEDKSSSAVDKDGEQEKDKGIRCSSPPQNMEQLLGDVMRTPQLSDFGLSAMQLKRTLTGAEWSSDVPSKPELNLPLLKTSAPPTMAMTPKCALRMDDNEFQMPQMHDFGISEPTVCLNDFTVDLFQKRFEKPQRPQDTAASTETSEEDCLQTKVDKLKSPELPSFCSLGLKIKRTNGFTPEQNKSGPECPGRPHSPPSTPEAPQFQTPYLKRLVSTKKSEQPEPIDVQSDEDNYAFNLETPCRGSTKNKWEYKVPEMPVFSVEDKQMPEMPPLESLGNFMQIKNKSTMKMGENDKTGKDTGVNSLELDGPTQEFSLGTPRIRGTYQDPSTPEMPDLSSVTLDICKLVSQAQIKKTTAASQQSHGKPENNRRCPVPQPKGLSVVSQSEFQMLPDYLRRMTLSVLNQAINNINRHVTECGAETSMFTTEELRRISGVGIMAPVYILCLKELKRLKQVEGSMSTDVYKLITQN